MTIKELIVKLEAFPEDRRVLLGTYDDPSARYEIEIYPDYPLAGAASDVVLAPTADMFSPRG